MFKEKASLKKMTKEFDMFSDDIFNDKKSHASVMKQDFVGAMEAGDFALLSENLWFMVNKLEDGGLQFIFTSKPKDREEDIKLYLSQKDSILFFDELVAVREGIFSNINLTDKENNFSIGMQRSRSELCTFDYTVNGHVLVKVTGTYGIFQKLIYYILYARYYN